MRLLPCCSATWPVYLKYLATWRKAHLRTLRSEEHTSELQSHRDLHSFPTRRSSDLDIMTERYEVTTMLQRDLAGIPEVFGYLEKGTPENPEIGRESCRERV